MWADVSERPRLDPLYHKYYTDETDLISHLNERLSSCVCDVEIRVINSVMSLIFDFFGRARRTWRERASLCFARDSRSLSSASIAAIVLLRAVASRLPLRGLRLGKKFVRVCENESSCQASPVRIFSLLGKNLDSFARSCVASRSYASRPRV